MYLTNLIEGRFLFNLTVWDIFGRTDSVVVELKINKCMKEHNIVKLIVNQTSSNFSRFELQYLAGFLTFTLSSSFHETHSVNIHFTKIQEDSFTGNLVIDFYAILQLQPGVDVSTVSPIISNTFLDTNRMIINSPWIVDRLWREERILKELQIIDIFTKYCLSDCSGHGICSNTTRKCECDFYWMANIFNRLLNIRNLHGDCSWSTPYFWTVILLVASLLVLKILYSYCANNSCWNENSLIGGRYSYFNRLSQSQCKNQLNIGRISPTRMKRQSDQDRAFSRGD